MRFVAKPLPPSENASTIASAKRRPAIRAPAASEKASLDVIVLPRPVAVTVPPAVPFTTTDPDGPTLNHPESSRFFFRHFR